MTYDELVNNLRNTLNTSFNASVASKFYDAFKDQPKVMMLFKERKWQDSIGLSVYLSNTVFLLSRFSEDQIKKFASDMWDELVKIENSPIVVEKRATFPSHPVSLPSNLSKFDTRSAAHKKWIADNIAEGFKGTRHYTRLTLPSSRIFELLNLICHTAHAKDALELLDYLLNAPAAAVSLKHMPGAVEFVCKLYERIQADPDVTDGTLKNRQFQAYGLVKDSEWMKKLRDNNIPDNVIMQLLINFASPNSKGNPVLTDKHLKNIFNGITSTESAKTLFESLGFFDHIDPKHHNTLLTICYENTSNLAISAGVADTNPKQTAFTFEDANIQFWPVLKCCTFYPEECIQAFMKCHFMSFDSLSKYYNQLINNASCNEAELMDAIVNDLKSKLDPTFIPQINNDLYNIAKKLIKDFSNVQKQKESSDFKNELVKFLIDNNVVDVKSAIQIATTVNEAFGLWEQILERAQKDKSSEEKYIADFLKSYCDEVVPNASLKITDKIAQDFLILIKEKTQETFKNELYKLIVNGGAGPDLICKHFVNTLTTPPYSLDSWEKLQTYFNEKNYKNANDVHDNFALPVGRLNSNIVARLIWQKLESRKTAVVSTPSTITPLVMPVVKPQNTMSSQTLLIRELATLLIGIGDDMRMNQFIQNLVIGGNIHTWDELYQRLSLHLVDCKDEHDATERLMRGGILRYVKNYFTQNEVIVEIATRLWNDTKRASAVAAPVVVSPIATPEEKPTAVTDESNKLLFENDVNDVLIRFNLSDNAKRQILLNLNTKKIMCWLDLFNKIEPFINLEASINIDAIRQLGIFESSTVDEKTERNIASFLYYTTLKLCKSHLPEKPAAAPLVNTSSPEVKLNPNGLFNTPKTIFEYITTLTNGVISPSICTEFASQLCSAKMTTIYAFEAHMRELKSANDVFKFLVTNLPQITRKISVIELEIFSECIANKLNLQKPESQDNSSTEPPDLFEFLVGLGTNARDVTQIKTFFCNLVRCQYFNWFTLAYGLKDCQSSDDVIKHLSSIINFDDYVTIVSKGKPSPGSNANYWALKLWESTALQENIAEALKLTPKR